MKRKDARRLVDESGLPEPDEKGRWHLTINDLLRFASFVADKERAQCLKFCDSKDVTFIYEMEQNAAEMALEMVASAIRERSHPQVSFFED